MATGMTLTELAAELDRQRAAREDYVADTRRLGFYAGSDGEAISLDGVFDARNDSRLFFVNDHAHAQIAARLGIPKRYYDRMREEAPKLLEGNVRHWFAERPEERLIRILDGRVRAFLSNRYRRLDNYDLAERAIFPTLSEIPGIEVVSSNLTDLRMYLRVVLPSVQAEVKVGDVVQAGVEISNSEVGAGALDVRPRLYRLVCSNGMVVPVDAVAGFALRKYHVGRQIEGAEENAYAVFTDETLAADDEAFFLKVRDVVKAALDETAFAQIVSRMQELAAETLPVEDVPRAVERLADRYDLAETESKSILRHLISGGDLSSWGFANAITRTAQDVESYDRESEIERLGGVFATLDRQARERILVG